MLKVRFRFVFENSWMKILVHGLWLSKLERKGQSGLPNFCFLQDQPTEYQLCHCVSVKEFYEGINVEEDGIES